MTDLTPDEAVVLDAVRALADGDQAATLDRIGDSVAVGAERLPGVLDRLVELDLVLRLDASTTIAGEGSTDLTGYVPAPSAPPV